MPDPITGAINRCIEIGSDYPDPVIIPRIGDINAGADTFRGAAIDGSETAAIASVNEGRSIAAGANGIKSRARGLEGKRG